MTVYHRPRHGTLSLILALCSIVFTGKGTLIAQPESDKPNQADQATGMGGSNTGDAHAAVLDEEHRPITAGGFVKNNPVIFQDIAKKAGLSGWTHTMGFNRYIQ